MNMDNEMETWIILRLTYVDSVHHFHFRSCYYLFGSVALWWT